MNCSIVIPVYNNLVYTRQCLDSLRRAGLPSGGVVVIDNGSTDGSHGFLAAQSDLKVIHNPENRGCGFAWNQGINASTVDWVILLNNDVVLPRQWLSGLLDFAESRRCDIVSPAMCEGELDYELQRHADIITNSMANAWRKGVAHAVCLMVHRRVFRPGPTSGIWLGDYRQVISPSLWNDHAKIGQDGTGNAP